tara:strand:+ start:157 stop:861 length:705 start_codon:yes stop_codon:yes gene_type:complete
MRVKINKRHQKLLLLQRIDLISEKQRTIRKKFGRFLFTNLFVNFFISQKEIENKINDEFLKEFNSIKNYLPKNSKNILDIGCGLGVINIYLNDYYSKKPYFTLIDKNYVDKKVAYGFNNNSESYNKLEITKDFLILNGFKTKQLKLINADENFVINNKYELIISLFSMGYHYPIENYIDIIKKNSTKSTKVIFDLSMEYNELNKVKNFFNKVVIIKSDNKVKQNYLRLLCSEIN